MIANDKNCWGNVQESAEPWKLSFDVTMRALWQPLLAPGHGVDLATVQPESLMYEPLNRSDIEAVCVWVPVRLSPECDAVCARRSSLRYAKRSRRRSARGVQRAARSTSTAASR